MTNYLTSSQIFELASFGFDVSENEPARAVVDFPSGGCAFISPMTGTAIDMDGEFYFENFEEFLQMLIEEYSER